MKKYKFIDSDSEDVTEKSRLSSKKRIMIDACLSSSYRRGGVSSAVIFSEPPVRSDSNHLDNSLPKDSVSEYKLRTEPPPNPNEYFQHDRCPLVKSREEIQFWVDTSRPPCLYYSDDDSPREVFKNGLKRRLNSVQEIHADSSDSSVENNYKTYCNKMKKNNKIGLESVRNNFPVQPKITVKVESKTKTNPTTKSEGRKELFKRTQSVCVDNGITPKILLRNKNLNDASMHVERGSFNFNDGKCQQTLKRRNPVSIETSVNEIPYKKAVQIKENDFIDDFDSGSSVLTINYIRSVNNAAKLNGKKLSTKNNKHFLIHDNRKSPQKRCMAADMYDSTVDDCKVLRRNQCENYVQNKESLNRMKSKDKNPMFTKSANRELPRRRINRNEDEYLNDSRNTKPSRTSIYPSHDELKKTNEKFLESCRESSSSIENEAFNPRRNKVTKTIVSQVVSVKTITSNIIERDNSYSDDDDSSSGNSDSQINSVNKSKNRTIHTISFSKVANIQYVVNH